MAYITKDQIRKRIIREFRRSGWTIKDGRLVAPNCESKEEIRAAARTHRILRAKRDEELVRSAGPDLLRHFASGCEIDPTSFDIELRPVEKDSLEAELFRFATLFWSIPVSRGYGRRMRYLAIDRSNGKVAGILALGDPVFNLRARDQVIGWDTNGRSDRLYHVLDAYTLGAVPPYNQLLTGKLIGMLAVSNEIRQSFNRKYRSNESVIKERVRNASLVLVTTTSSLGRSSIYNRLRLPNEKLPLFRSVGYTSGFGHFQVSDELFSLIRAWLRQRKDAYADNHQYGDGPSWRMRAIRRAIDLLGIEGDGIKHGVQREVFLAPTARNYDRFLRGEISNPHYYDRPLSDIVAFFRERWMMPRSNRMDEWRNWSTQDSWSLISSLYS